MSTTPKYPSNPIRHQPVSAETKAENANARWASLAEKGVQESQVSRRRFWMIASVILAGGAIWLVATTYLGSAG
jgi:hypothetical protein